jgi:hypothetical protein
MTSLFQTDYRRRRVGDTFRWPHSWADPCVQVCVPYPFESAAALRIPNHGLRWMLGFPLSVASVRLAALSRRRSGSVVNSAFGCRYAALGSLRLANCSLQAEPKAPHREESALDFQPLTTIQQNSFTLQPAPSRTPITLISRSPTNGLGPRRKSSGRPRPRPAGRPQPTRRAV